jgi:hypothetical protein
MGLGPWRLRKYSKRNYNDFTFTHIEALVDPDFRPSGGLRGGINAVTEFA